MERDIDGYTGLPNYSMNISKSGDMTLVFSQADIAADVTPEVKKSRLAGNLSLRMIRTLSFPHILR